MIMQIRTTKATLTKPTTIIWKYDNKNNNKHDINTTVTRTATSTMNQKLKATATSGILFRNMARTIEFLLDLSGSVSVFSFSFQLQFSPRGDHHIAPP
jgi:hypothetical protein